MTNTEAIRTLSNHKANDIYNAYEIGQALEIAITALEIQEKIKKIIYIDNMIIQEDVMKYKMICEVMKE